MHNLRSYLFLFFCLVNACNLFAQPMPDSVKRVYNNTENISAKNECLYRYLESIRGDRSYVATTAELKKYFEMQHDASSVDYVEMSQLGNLAKTGDYITALNRALVLLELFKKRKDDYGEMIALDKVAQSLYFAGDQEQSIVYAKQKLVIAEKIHDYRELALGNHNIASTYASLKKPDSGMLYGRRALFYSEKLPAPLRWLTLSNALASLAENFIVKEEYDSAVLMLRQAIPINTDASNLNWLYGDLTESFAGKKQWDSTKHYADITIALGQQRNFKDQVLRGCESLYKMYDETGNTDSAYKYFKLAVEIREELFSLKKTNEIRAINLREQARQQQAVQEKIAFKNRIEMFALVAGFSVILIIAFILFRNNRLKQKANVVLAQQKTQVETTLQELKATQAQLIQSEKMASLGELTAGIAHEIQNPLNFVNNFSEVNKEMVDEVNEELDKGNVEEAQDILRDIKANSEKINHHGKRADAIVKGMLQHSRSSAGQKERADINALCDEYLRLSYHGLRAKDKSFNAILKTDFDKSIGKINMVPQDIGRVILNLITNAFYAVDQKKRLKTYDGAPKTDEPYDPAVFVSTRKVNNGVEICVADNGNGIPASIKEKIFQPFFTTKPTGQGTGLGLSLAYDIIKAHSGEIKVESDEGNGTTFIIRLPSTNA